MGVPICEQSSSNTVCGGWLGLLGSYHPGQPVSHRWCGRAPRDWVPSLRSAQPVINPWGCYLATPRFAAPAVGAAGRPRGRWHLQRGVWLNPGHHIGRLEYVGFHELR